MQSPGVVDLSAIVGSVVSGCALVSFISSKAEQNAEENAVHGVWFTRRPLQRPLARRSAGKGCGRQSAARHSFPEPSSVRSDRRRGIHQGWTRSV